MNNLIDLLKQKQEEEQLMSVEPGVQSSVQPQNAVQAITQPGPSPVLPSNYNDLAQAEANDSGIAPEVPANVSESIKMGIKSNLPVPNQQEIAQTGAPQSPIDRLTSLRQQLDDLRGQETQQIADVNDERMKKTMLAGLTEGLGKYAVGGLQKNVKAPNINYTGPSAKDLLAIVGEKARPNLLNQKQDLLKEYALLKNAEKNNGITPYQEAYLKLQRDQLAQKERALQLKKDKGEGLTKGQEASDRDFAKRYNEWTSVGAPKVEKNLTILKDAADKLEAMTDKTNNISGRYQGRLPDLLQNEDAITMRDDIQSTALESLRQTLGAQFTENEGKKIMEKAYNPTLSPKENAKKLRRVIGELESQQAENNAKTKHFEGSGTLKGYSAGTAETPQQTPKTVKIQGPSGQVAEVSAEKAEKYLSKPGYKQIP